MVHRLKPRTDKKPRNIIAKLKSRKDRNKVLEKAKEKLKNDVNFGLHSQYPMEMIEKRKELIPIMLDARSKNLTAVLKDDKLLQMGGDFPLTHHNNHLLMDNSGTNKGAVQGVEVMKV